MCIRARLIAAEAGAVVSDFGGNPPDEVSAVAAAPGIHQALIDAIANASR